MGKEEAFLIGGATAIIAALVTAAIIYLIKLNSGGATNTIHMIEE